MKIFITGSTGMVGKNVLECEDFLQHDLLTPSRLEVDLLKYEDVYNYLKRNEPDLVLHLAGRVGGIQANIAQPIEYMVENMDISRNVIMAAFQAGIKKMINVGSSCMYPRDAKGPLSENLILTGELETSNEGYALSKIMAQRLCSYIGKSNSGFQYKTLIPSNLYGRYDYFNLNRSHFIPSIILKVHQAFQNRKKLVQIWGTGEVRRESLFVQDFVECLARCLTHFETLPDVMNVGHGLDYTMNEYYQAVAKIVGYHGGFEYDLDQPEGMRQKLVSTELAQHWGWRGKTSLSDGLRKTYHYFLQTIRNDDGVG